LKINVRGESGKEIGAESRGGIGRRK